MLKKLALTANWLDSQGLFREADAVTDVMRRYAFDTLFEPDDSEDEEIEAFKPKFSHDLESIDLNDPAHLDILSQISPNFHAQLMPMLEAARASGRGKPSEKLYGGRKVMLPPGMASKFKGGDAPFRETDFSKFFIGDEDAQANAEAARGWLDRATRGRSRRGTFGLEYAGGSKPGARPVVFDPHLDSLMGDDSEPHGLIGMWDQEKLRSIFDPTYEEADLNLREKAMNKPEDSPLEDFPYALGWARRRYAPEGILGMERMKRDVDPETGKKKPFFYLRNRPR